ncbi:t-SNARE syntaxin NDAI_0E01920 [Naumovozyma dairenensis CBS 421]|uniref:t-SNARE coiled-coil homology domain-containing protein n=1 Tax=Naumovozyma dairenensis (strain ATCC 10597 / BCRC 20456 / CBS 421 / NBRC 0211 / NRRL Y-12639) TaxID=1071378 RepID=G0WB88_NAUDC|nr:hypothetical protein NDAI_0E01920 [Naumovozyma dairenensis CBS 421]CCD25008.1 hypothetical protein NDAI_0E01920 [Naumovozyma dairenensis CBS 421]
MTSLQPRNIRDRTSEFQQSVLTCKKRSKQSQQQQTQANTQRGKISDFQRNASLIANEISQTAQLLSKLAILAKRKPMVNDSPVEIAELSFLIKRKIYSIESSLIELSKSRRNNKSVAGVNDFGRRNTGDEHSSNVVTLLNTKMKNISGDFKNVLEMRQQLELNNMDRWEKISKDEQLKQQQQQQQQIPQGHTQPGQQRERQNDGTIEDSNKTGGSNVMGTSSYNSSNPFMTSLINDEEDDMLLTNQSNYNKDGSGGLTLPQSSDKELLLMEEGLVNNNVYLQERNQAVETIESTIQEVGNLFQQLASMVQEQGEVIQRIDANVDDIDLNITGAQRELLKYFDRIKSNRWLAVKIFFIIFVFFLLWVLVN